MVHETFDPASIRLSTSQSGEGNYFEGRIFQRGRGLGYTGRHTGEGMGDVLKTVWRFIRPIAVGAAKTVGKESLGAGGRILSNLAQGADLKDTVQREGKEGVKRVLERASQRLQRGYGARRGRGGRRPRRHRLPSSSVKGSLLHPKVVVKPEDVLIGKSIPKSTAIKRRASKSDNLGFY
jgi:hypothetical protein